MGWLLTIVVSHHSVVSNVHHVMSSPVSVQRVEKPTEDEVNASVAICVALMETNVAAISLSGADPALMDPMVRCTLRACVHSGEFYTATDKTGEVIGFSLWMPPGQELFSTPEQRSLGFTDFMNSLPEIGKQYYATTYLAEFPGFVTSALSPTTKLDSWWCHQLMVRTEYQRKGVARALLAPVIDKAKRNGDTLALSTTNDDNIPVYTRLGFILKGSKTIPSPWGDWPLHVFELKTK